MKTADRILMISLELFNQQGEPNVSSVDIANELDISPGNLYYHYKGKEYIVAALYQLYQKQMSRILLAPNRDQLDIEDFFYYLLMILEVSHKFLFLYRNPVEIAANYPAVATGFQRILTAKQKTYTSCIKSFAQQGLVVGNANHQQQMVELVGLLCTQMPNYYQMLGRDITDGSYIYQSLSTTLFALAPYLNIEREVFESLVNTLMVRHANAAESDSE